jgi:hypothetical protein
LMRARMATTEILVETRGASLLSLKWFDNQTSAPNAARADIESDAKGNGISETAD